MVDKQKHVELIIQTNRDVRYLHDDLTAYISGNVGSSEDGQEFANVFLQRHKEKIDLHEFYIGEYDKYSFSKPEVTEGLYISRGILFTEETYDEALNQLKDLCYQEFFTEIKKKEERLAESTGFFAKRALKKEIESDREKLNTVRDNVKHISRFKANNRIVIRFNHYNPSDLDLICKLAIEFEQLHQEIPFKILDFHLRTIETVETTLDVFK